MVGEALAAMLAVLPPTPGTAGTGALYAATNRSKVSLFSQIKAWTVRLANAITLADSLPLTSGMVSLYVIHQKSGSRYTRDAFNAQWMKAKKAAADKFPELEFNFTFHDLKAKGISDLEGTLHEKQEISGHKNASQTARYNRKISVVPVVGGQ